MLTDEQKLERYIKQQDEKTNKHEYIRMVEEIEKFKNYSLGDILNIKNYNSWGSRKGYSPEFYRVDGVRTKIEVKYKVVYIDNGEFSHVQRIQSDGRLSAPPFSLIEHYGCLVIEGGGRDVEIDKLITLDPDFVDSTLLQSDYDPLAVFREAEDEKEKEIKEAVIAYCNIKDHNKRLRTYTGSVRGRDKLYKDTKVGDVIYCRYWGNLTLKIKDNDIMVFAQKGGSLVTMDKDTLKDHQFSSVEPKAFKSIPRDIDLRKYKPTKK